MWTWSSDQTAGFWLRKLTHDTIVHRIDTDLATDREPRLAADLAAAGVSELLSSIAALSASDHPDPIFAGLRGNGETLQLHATDVRLGAAGQWLVWRTPVGVRSEYGHDTADVTAHATALNPLQVLNRRATPSRVEVPVLQRHFVI